MGSSLVCSRCVLSADVPRTTFDAEGVCNVCLEYKHHQAAYDRYFCEEEALLRLRAESGRTHGAFDCLLLYSGGKDSTYVLYRLVDFGFRVLTMTFDNGYLPAGCFDNIRNVCNAVGVENVLVRVEREAMNEVFAISLERDATVCSGCFRALTARSTELAIARGIPLVVTGLSRGQIFHTKVHQLLRAGIVEVDRIDGYLDQFRYAYHAAQDTIAVLIRDRALVDPEGFARTRFIDFFRYSSVTKREIMQLIATRAAFWQRPAHVGGCSTNCMINDVGIEVHRQRKGYHNYTIPLAWDVRFGHISREDALHELQADIDAERTGRILRNLARYTSRA